MSTKQQSDAKSSDSGRDKKPDATKDEKKSKPPFHKAYSFGLVTGALFVASWTLQLVFQAIAFGNEAAEHGGVFEWSEYWPQFFASTFENWQSEFLQLVWQAAGLALFYFWGSSQSREGDNRVESKIDALLKERGIDPDEFDYEERRELA
jgi:hypothetical protein